MDGRKPYRYFSAFVHSACLFIGVAFVICGCGQNGQKKNDRQSGSGVLRDSVNQQDTMKGMTHAHHGPGTRIVKADSVAEFNTLRPDSSHDETYWVKQPTNRTVISTAQAISPERSKMEFSINGNGYIAFDFRRNHKVPVRVGGRIEKLFVKYNYQYVRKGEKILELYSPELNTYVDEYLYVTRHTNDSILQEKSKQKLSLLGLSPSEIAQIDQSGNISPTISVYSPFEGYVLFNPAGTSSAAMGNAPVTSSGMSSGMDGADQKASNPVTILPDNSVREGMYVSKDQTLFWINDFRECWGIIAFTTDEEKYLRKGQGITIESELLPEKQIQGTIQLVEPVYQEGQKFTQVRVNLPNSRQMLKQNSLITATVSISHQSLTVPVSSVYWLGRMAMVWVQVGVSKEGSNIFQSRVVRTGYQDSESIEIEAGLKQGETVAKDASYLADSEAIINY